ncbi:S-adenosyl-L-methionine-dependent methyltransferase, partial [Ascobolus immersus RN42]
DDDDSSCGGSTADSYTTSLSSSVFDFVYENGRRYASNRTAKTTEYLIPNDEAEQSRLDLVHHLWGLILSGDLHRAPIDAAEIKRRAGSEEPFRVLDLGTGTGIWAIDFGDEYPGAEVLGIDLSPIQPEWVPPNVKFEVDNFEDEWVFGHKFDYIHCRNLVGSIKDYPGLMKKIYNNLAPGGIVEFQESHVTGTYSEDNTFTSDSALAEYNRLLTEACNLLGQPMDAAPAVKGYVVEAGFKDVKEQIHKAPLGTWPKQPAEKQIGAVFQEISATGWEAYGLAALTRVLGWEGAKAKEFLDRVTAEATNRKIHKIYPVHVVWGRKP